MTLHTRFLGAGQGGGEVPQGCEDRSGNTMSPLGCDKGDTGGVKVGDGLNLIGVL